MFLKNKWAISIRVSSVKYTESFSVKIGIIKRIKNWWRRRFTLELFIDLEEKECINDVLKIISRIKE